MSLLLQQEVSPAALPLRRITATSAARAMALLTNVLHLEHGCFHQVFMPLSNSSAGIAA
jgi:hypothetical protein